METLFTEKNLAYWKRSLQAELDSAKDGVRTQLSIEREAGFTLLINDFPSKSRECFTTETAYDREFANYCVDYWQRELDKEMEDSDLSLDSIERQRALRSLLNDAYKEQRHTDRDRRRS